MYTRVLSLRILAISVTRNIFCETYQGSEYGSYFNMAERGLVDSRMKFSVYTIVSVRCQCMCVLSLCEKI